MRQQPLPTRGQKAHKLDGRPTKHDQKKQSHTISITPDGWEGIQQQAKNNGCSSVSDLVERLGRAEFSITNEATDITQEDDRDHIKGTSLEDNLASFLDQKIKETLANALEQHLTDAFDFFFQKYFPHALYEALNEAEPVTKAVFVQQLTSAQWQVLRNKYAPGSQQEQYP